MVTKVGHWNGLRERLIFLVSLSAIVTTLMIFIFIGREAGPILLGQMDSSHHTMVITPANMGQHSDAELAKYLDMSLADFAKMDADTRKLMMEVKADAAKEAPVDKDSIINTASWGVSADAASMVRV